MSLQKTDLDELIGRIVTVTTKSAGQSSEGRLQRVTETAVCLFPVLVVSSAGELVFTDDCIAVVDLADVLSMRSTPEDVFARTYETMKEDVQEQQATHQFRRAQAKHEREREEQMFQQRQPVGKQAIRGEVRTVGQYL
jgi:hypothetical protein